MKSWNLNFLEPSGPLQAYSYMQRNLAVMCRFPAYPAYIRKLYKERTLFIRKLNFKKFSKGMSPILPTSPFSAFYLILVLNKQPSWARVHKSRGSGCHGAQAPNTVCPTRYRTSLIILPLMRILQRNLKRTTDTFLFISHTKNVLLFKFRCNIFVGVRIIKEMPGSLASGTHCIYRSLVHNMFHVILLAPTDLTWRPDFLDNSFTDWRDRAQQKPTSLCELNPFLQAAIQSQNQAEHFLY